MKFIAYTLVAFAALSSFFSCDEDTALIGQSIMPKKDLISTSQDTFYVKTTSIAVDSVLANTSTSLLGSIIDPETRATTTAGFLAQFNILENTTFPKKDSLVWDTDGLPKVDSVYMYMYVSSYYGDSLRTMKLTVQELDTAKVMAEGVKYYTNISPAQYITDGVGIQASTTYSVHDDALASNVATGTAYHYLRINLPKSFGKRILNKYYEQPAYFKNSQLFLRHVLAGFHFSTPGSVGTMLQVPFTTLNIHFQYKKKNVATSVYTQMASTEEVIQNTSVSSKIPAHMLDANNDFTYVKSPASIFTEGTLPIDNILDGHVSDSINNARLTIRTYNSTATSTNSLNAPTHLLLVAKSNMHKFFEENRLPNNVNSFLAPLTNGSYTYSNISGIISYMRQLRDTGTQIANTDTEAQKASKRSLWESQNLDWNKFVLIPVTAEYSITKEVKTLRRIRHSMGLNSVKLEGGAGKGLELNVMYSSFKNQ